MQPTTSNNDLRLVFPYHVHNQADFDNPFINRKGLIYLCISKLNFTFYVFARVQVSVSIKTARKAARPLLQVAGIHVSKFLNSNIYGTKSDVIPKQRYDRFPSVGDHIHVLPTFKSAWATPGHTVTGGF